MLLLLPRSLFSKLFSFLLLFGARRALEVSTSPERLLGGWVGGRDARGKPSPLGSSVCVPRCREQEVMPLSALIEGP